MGEIFVGPDFNKLPYSLCLQGDKGHLMPLHQKSFRLFVLLPLFSCWTLVIKHANSWKMIALEVGLNPGPSKHIYKAAALSTMLRLLVNEKANSSPPPLFRLRYVRMNGVTVNHFLFAYISDDGTSCPCSTAVNRFFCLHFRWWVQLPQLLMLNSWTRTIAKLWSSLELSSFFWHATFQELCSIFMR